MKKVFKFIPALDCCEPFACVLVKNTYFNNGRLAVDIVNLATGESWASLTVNLVQEDLTGDKSSHAFIDTNNVGEAVDFIKKNKIATPTGFIGLSGYCTYPEYKFDLTHLIEPNEFTVVYNDYYGGNEHD